MDPELQTYLSNDFGLPQKLNDIDAAALLAEKINQLIKENFEKVVSLLYRIDVNENKLREVLRQSPNEDAGKIIASLIIERQLEKIKTRRNMGRDDNSFTSEERW
jgi:hypothetical protein